MYRDVWKPQCGYPQHTEHVTHDVRYIDTTLRGHWLVEETENPNN